jgi:hypothetical protein
MASKGRDGDSMLVHMTPGEVHGLQALAMKHGGSLTTNPDTGLPEANFLKSLLPMLAGFALGPAGFGLVSSAMGAGAIVGGITGIATGSLSKGLMAGLGAYGGFGIGEGLMGAGADAMTRGALSAEGALPSIENITQVTGEGYGGSAANYSDQVNSAVKAARDASAAMPTSDLMSAGSKAAMDDPMGFAKQNWKPIAAAALPVLSAIGTTTPGQAPTMAPGRIREKRWDGRQFVDVANTDAGVYNTSGRSYSDLYRGYNDGGIVALANGGDVQHFAIGDLVKADIDKAYAAGDYGAVQKLVEQNQITAADVSNTYKGFDTSGLAGLGINLYNPAAETAYQATGSWEAAAKARDDAANAANAATWNQQNTDKWNAQNQATWAAQPIQYTDAQIGKYLTDNPNVDIAKAIKDTRADPAAVNKYIASLATPFVGSTDTTGGSGTLRIYNQMKAQGIDPNEFYSAAIANDPKYAGWTKEMIQKGYDLDKGAYALTAQIEKDKIAADPVLGYDKQWVKYMEDNKYSVDDMAQAFGISKNEIRDRIQKVKAAETKVVTKDTVTGGTGNDVITKSGYHLDDNGVLVPNISATQNTTTTVAEPTDLFTAPATSLPVGVAGNTGPSQIGGGATVNPNGTITTSPRIPGIPVGGFTGMKNLRDTYTKGGGSLGYTSPVPESLDAFTEQYVNKRMGGDSLAAYNYLTGKGGAKYPTKSGVGQISEDYATAVLGYPARGNLPYIYNKATGKMDPNPDYVAPGRDAEGNVTYSMSLNDIKSSLKDKPLAGQALYDWAKSNNLSAQQIADATGRSLSSVYSDFRAGSKAAADTAKTGGDTIQVTDSSGYDTETVTATKQADGTYLGSNGKKYDASGKGIMAGGGMTGYAIGGGLGSLGGYSDGGRLLKGPGDGVSDSIPATIGAKQQPARLADGEFVVPARIVSELGNGSTDAGAKKLYAMMDRVQRARGKTTGKNKVAANSRADKYLPA